LIGEENRLTVSAGVVGGVGVLPPPPPPPQETINKIQKVMDRNLLINLI